MPSSELTSRADLVLQARTGDHQAFAVLMRTHENAVRAVCRGFAEDPDDVEDLVLETFVEAYLNLRRLRNPKAFASWLRTIARNLCLSWIRDQRVDVGRLDHEPAAPLREDACDDRVVAGMSRLSDDHRQVLDLHYRAGMSYQDVADELDVPIGTVMSRLHRARHALKEAVEMAEEDEMEEESNLEHRFRMEIELLEGLGAAVEMEGGWVGRVKVHNGAIVRIRKLLENDPSSLIDLLRVCETPDHYVHLAWVVRQHPHAPLPVLAASALSDNEEVREGASRLAEGWATRTWYTHRTADLFLDTVIASPAPDERKAKLLVRLIQSVRAEGLNTMEGVRMMFELTRVLVGYPEAAFPILWEALWQLDEDDVVEYGVRTAIAHLPGLYIDAFLDEVKAGDSRRVARLLRDLHLLRVPELPERLHPILSDLLASSDPMIAERARTLCVRFRVPHVVPILQHRLESKDHDVRANTVRELAQVSGKGALPHILPLLDDDSPLVRTASLMALGRMDATSAKHRVVERLENDPDDSVRESAVRVYGKVATTEERAACFDRIKKSGGRRLLRVAARSLFDSRAPRRKSRLEEERLKRIRGGAEPEHQIDPIRALRSLPEIRSYEEEELTSLVAAVCEDYSTTRRQMVMEGRFALMRRQEGIYTFTPMGEAVWRVGRFIEKAKEDLTAQSW